MGKQAVIIGGAAKPKNIDFELFRNPDVEVWGINAIRKKWVPRWDRMFNIHKYELLLHYGWPVDVDAEWASEHPEIPFYTADKWPDGRMSRAKIFPRTEMSYMPRSNYHCNSFDWLIAFAIHNKFDAVHLHGCQVSLDPMEQLSARACIEYWAGYAEASGTKIFTAKDCNLFYAFHFVQSKRVYGYDDCPAFEDRTSAHEAGRAPYRFDE